jgi:predicted MFS family arabinose efflux permease
VAFPLSNGLGALLNGLAVDLAGYSWMFIIAAAICACGLALTAKNWSLLK